MDFPRKFEPSNLTREQIPEFIKVARRFSPQFLDYNLRKVTDEDIARMCEVSLENWEL